MSFRVSGKNIDIGEALRNRVNARIAEATAKYFDGGFSGHVIVDMLRTAGIDIARRTVAKYREAMRIPSSVQRRREKQSMLGATT